MLLAQVHDVRILLTGDEPEGQAALARTLPGLGVDVLKVPHHGSRYQDEDWLLSLAAEVAVVSVAPTTTGGHPAATTARAAERCRDRRPAHRRGRAVAVVADRRRAVGGHPLGWAHHGRPTHPRAADVLGRVTLVTGKEEFLNERTVTAVRTAVRTTTTRPSCPRPWRRTSDPGDLGELSAPSLFSSIRCVVVRGLENLPGSRSPGSSTTRPCRPEDVALVLVHGGGPRGAARSPGSASCRR